MKHSVALASSYLMNGLGIDVSIVHVEMVLPVQDVMETRGCLAACFLDAGCDCIVLEMKSDSGCSSSCWEEMKEIVDECGLPKERMVLRLNDDSWEKLLLSNDDNNICIEEMKERFRVLSIPVKKETDMKRVAETIIEKGFQFILEISSSSDDDDDDNDVISPASIGAFSKSIGENHGHVTLIDPPLSHLASSYASCLKTDRSDGLYTTVVCTRSNEALGLVYSSSESIAEALRTGRGVYYSRSRRGLWKKGDTSGHYQTLHRLDVDCDGDALRFTVTQEGENVKAFCHLNTLTCWGEPWGLRHLEGVLQQRLKDAPEGSYTKRLFEDDELLRDKLVEEAQELSEAEGKQHVAEELADVLYFAMVRAAKAGVSIDDAVSELDRRARKVTRRQGDSKAFRIEAGDKILGKSKESK